MENGDFNGRLSDESAAVVIATDGAPNGEKGPRRSGEGPPQPLSKAIATESSPLVDGVMQSDVGLLCFSLDDHHC